MESAPSQPEEARPVEAEKKKSRHFGILFYLLLFLFLASATEVAYYFWWPSESERPKDPPPAPTIVTPAPPQHAEPLIPVATSSPALATSTSAIPAINITTGNAPLPVVKKTPLQDRLRPSTPTGLEVLSAGEDNAAVTWLRSSDNVGVAGYILYHNLSSVGTTTKNIHIFSDLATSTLYVFGVAAYDAAGNSSDIARVLVRTATPPPPPPPPVETPAPDPVPVEQVVTPIIPQSLCGNGTQNIGEECDDGNNDDQDMCTTKCKAAFCRDGILNRILEQCDDGNEDDRDLCTNDCFVNPQPRTTAGGSPSQPPPSTPPPTDNTPPAISLSAPTDGSIVAGTIPVSASASDNIGVAGVQFLLDGTNIGAEVAITPYSFLWNTGFISNGSHTLSAVVRDAAGNTATAPTITVIVNNATPPPPDTTPPSVPAGLLGTPVSTTRIDLTWNASTDNNSGVAGYRVYRNGVEVASVTGVSYQNTGLSADTTYGYSVAAFDNAGNLSGQSSSISVKTQAPPPPVTVTINATKIVCAQESDFPNWGAGGPNVGLNTAANFIASHPTCHTEPGWSFQYGFGTKSGATGVVGLARDFIGEADGSGGAGTMTGAGYSNWKTFGPTNGSGLATVSISDLEGATSIWVREVLQSGYVPFKQDSAHPGNQNNISAELYCHTDVLNYDNLDQISSITSGSTYYCIAFNAPQ